MVFSALDMAWMHDLVAQARLPPGPTIAVIDRMGRILARRPAAETWVSKAVPDAPLLQAILAQRGEGTVEAPGLDGVPRLYAFTPLGGAPGVVTWS